MGFYSQLDIEKVPAEKAKAMLELIALSRDALSRLEQLQSVSKLALPIVAFTPNFFSSKFSFSMGVVHFGWK